VVDPYVSNKLAGMIAFDAGTAQDLTAWDSLVGQIKRNLVLLREQLVGEISERGGLLYLASPEEEDESPEEEEPPLADSRSAAIFL